MTLKQSLRDCADTLPRPPSELQGPWKMTDDPSEVRPGDVRSMELIVESVHKDGSGARVSTARPHYSLFNLSPYELAASTLIRRARPEIKVGSRVKWSGAIRATVDAISSDRSFAYLRDFSTRFDADCARVPLSDLTPVEDKADG